MLATWAEPLGPVLNSEGSLSFLRPSVIMKGVLGHNPGLVKFDPSGGLFTLEKLIYSG